MVDAPQPSLRDTNDGRRFLHALWMISATALIFFILSNAVNGSPASGSNFEDGISWIYDSIIYGLVAISFGRGVFLERASAIMLSLILAVAGCQGSYDIWSEIVRRAPEVASDSPIREAVFAAGTVFEAALLFRFRVSGDPLMKATWLSARNSAVIGVAGAAIPLLHHAPIAVAPQIFVDGLDTVLAFQAAFSVACEIIEI